MIQIEHLVKHYGDKYAVNDISFTAENNEIVGFLGPNGAGKTTTMNILTGYLSASSGRALIDGFDILDEAFEARRRIGYLPEHPPLYPDMTVSEYLSFVYGLKNCSYNKAKHLAEIMEIVKLSDVRGRLIRNLSKGYQQRVGIAQALVGNPKNIILDEPTVGLDPRQIIEIRNLVRTLGRDHTVILSTHVLGEVQAVCDRVVILNKGRLAADERTEDLVQLAGGTRRLSVKICGPQKQVLDALRKMESVTYVEALSEHELDSTTYLVESAAGVDLRKPLFRMLAQNGWPMIGMEALGINLEDIFLSLVEKSAPEKQKQRRIRVTPNASDADESKGV